ncbi:MAG TPA: PstA family ABC transporter permease [Pirellulaceae bacterium]|nr:PstA family ABC transporter permease [Pirellulaceae bacterium]
MTSPARKPKTVQADAPRQSIDTRRAIDRAFRIFCILATWSSVVMLIVLLVTIFYDGAGALSTHFVWNAPNADPSKAGIWPVMMGTAWVCLVCAAFSMPIGVATAIFLEEFHPKHKWLRHFHAFVQLNIQNLAGVPSIVYGILGLTTFVSMFGLFGNPKEPTLEFGIAFYDQFEAANEDLSAGRPASTLLVPVYGRRDAETPLVDGMDAYNAYGEAVQVKVLSAGQALPTDPEAAAVAVRAGTPSSRIERPRWYYVRLPFGRGVLAGSLTLMLVILPVVIISSQESLRAVPSSLRDGALGMGATPLQAVWYVTLPTAVPGIMTGAILAMSRAIGEAAPVMIVAGAIVNLSSPPSNLMDRFSIMPIQIYNWTEEANRDFHPLAAGSIILLLFMLLVFNGLAVFIRHRLQKPLQ